MNTYFVDRIGFEYMLFYNYVTFSQVSCCGSSLYKQWKDWYDQYKAQSSKGGSSSEMEGWKAAEENIIYN